MKLKLSSSLVCATICLVLLFNYKVHASVGDLNPDFQLCTADCTALYDCPLRADYYKWTQKPCFDCRYECMWRTVEKFQRHGFPVPKFFGKWPFTAISTRLGPFVILVQEPASTLFSFLNLCACFWLTNELVTKIPAGSSRLRSVWIGYALVGIICWIFSMVFHSRDFWLTEYLDYFAAAGVIFYAFYASLMLTIPFLQRHKKSAGIVFTATLLLYSRHVYYLFNRPTFDYGHNMFCCISLSLVTAAIYIFWTLKECYFGRYRPSLKFLLQTIAIGLGAAIFEVYDFPPFFFWSIDAHSLFHLATVPTPLLMAKFAVYEAEHERRTQKWKFDLGKAL